MQNLSEAELKNIKYVIRFGKNGHKYTWQNISKDKILKLVQKYGIDDLGDDYVWLSW